MTKPTPVYTKIKLQRHGKSEGSSKETINPQKVKYNPKKVDIDAIGKSWAHSLALYTDIIASEKKGYNAVSLLYVLAYSRCTKLCHSTEQVDDYCTLHTYVIYSQQYKSVWLSRILKFKQLTYASNQISEGVSLLLLYDDSVPIWFQSVIFLSNEKKFRCLTNHTKLFRRLLKWAELTST